MSQTKFMESKIPIGSELRKVVLYRQETFPNNWILLIEVFTLMNANIQAVACCEALCIWKHR